MPSGFRKTDAKGRNFEIYYEQPWGGVASDKDPADIEPNQLLVQDGAIILNGALHHFAMLPFSAVFTGTRPATGNASYLAVFFVVRGALYSCDNLGQIFRFDPGPMIWVPALGGVVVAATPVTAIDYPWGANQPPNAARVVNGTVYISNYARNSVYSWSFNYNGLPAYTMLQATNYAGGKYMGVLDDYLIQLNTNTPVDREQPNRVNWSGPGKFSTWDPSLDRTAGYNTLASVEDQITGFLSLASVGLILTQKGFVEMSPTGSAIQPFNFTTLWNSDVGSGCLYGDTVCQYGPRGFLVTDSGIFSVTVGGGLADIGGVATKAIQQSFQDVASLHLPNAAYHLVTATICLYAINSSYSTPCYIVCAVPRQLFLYTEKLVFWVMNLNTGTWQSLNYTIPDLIAAQNGPTTQLDHVVSVSARTFDMPSPQQNVNTTLVNPITLINVVCQLVDGSFYNLVLTPFFQDTGNVPFDTDKPAPLTLRFKQEEIQLGHSRKATIRRIVIKAYGYGILFPTITGADGQITNFTPVMMDGSLYSKTYYSDGVATVEAPQLTISATQFQGSISKAMLVGTVGDGEID